MKRTRGQNERNGLTMRQYYALIWKDFVVHKRHYIWTMLEITIPVLVCAMAILSNSHPGKPKLEPERVFDPDDYERLYGELNPARHRLLVAPNSSFTRALVEQIDDGAVSIELCESEEQLVELIKQEIPVSLDQVKRLLPDESQNVTIGGVVVRSDWDFRRQMAPASNATSRSRPRDDGRRSNLNLHHHHHRNHRPALDEAAKTGEYYEVASKLDGSKMRIPVELDLAIRAKDFRLGPEPFPKKYSLGPFLHSDHYQTTFFMASQIMVSRAYINLLANYLIPANSSTEATNETTTTGGSSTRFADIVIPSNDDLIGQKIPYPKYVAHKRLKETTLGTFVAGSQKQKPFVLTMDYCICVGFLVTAIFLAKRIVDEKKSRVRDMLRLVGISDVTYYGSHMTNTMLIMGLQCCLITMLFTGHQDAPAQNIDSTLMFAILLLYCLSAVMFVLTLSTMFNSSTKAIIFTSLLWLGAPELLDRVFKMNSGVIESNGFLAVDERYHLLFCLMPNFGLRLMNRLLTECDIYGEFYAKKELYGEYRAIWPNLFNVLPLYKTITVGHIMLVMLASLPFYFVMIYLINSTNEHTASGLASLSSESGPSSANSREFSCCGLAYLVKLVFVIISAPLKLIHKLLFRKSKLYDQNDPFDETVFSSTQQINPGKRSTLEGNLNAAYAASLDSILKGDAHKKNGSGGQSQPGAMHTIELGQMASGQDEAAATPEHSDNDPAYFERAPGMLQCGVSIRNVCKTYITPGASLRRTDAVRNVSLDMYYSQILVLLGHNGAGKTTLIDIISGHNRKTSGQIVIDGHDIDAAPTEARRHVGFCPQFDVLFERLTVYEHLYFYGIVKGARDELGAEIEQLLAQSGLDRHRNKLSKALSGGYKRKLSLAIAMIAKSRLLILDEPTSGMDPESRRKVWDFLQVIRQDRLILMTTHHMEEADALGDRIAVMSHGQVKCCGSALFLKRVFNTGYHLRISKSAAWNQVAFEELVGIKYKLQDKLENMTPHELMYKFDVAETSELLPALFDDLERVKERVGIFGFGITVSTMDDVFMKIGLHFKDVDAQEMQNKFELANKSSSSNNNNNNNNNNNTKHLNGASSGDARSASSVIKMNGGSSLSAMAGSSKERVEGRQLFRQQMRAMLAKRYHHARKNWFQLVWILMVSLSCVTSIVLLIDFVIFKEELTPEWSRDMTLEGAGYGRHTTGVYQFAPPASETAADEAASIEALRDLAFPASAAAPSTTSSTTTASSAPEVSSTEASPSSSEREREPLTTTTELAPVTTTTTTTMASTSAPSTSEKPSEQPASEAPEETTAATTSSTTTPNPKLISEVRRRRSQLANARRIRRLAPGNLIEGQNPVGLNDSALFLDRYWLSEAERSGMEHLLTYTDVNTQMVDLLTSQFADFRERYIVGGEKVGKKYIAWYNGEATHSFPISMNIMLNSILRQFTDLIQESGHPMKGSRISLKHVAMAQINTLIAFLPHLGRLINLVFLPFSLAFITSYFVIFPTHERVTKSKHLQLMTGIPARTFWLSHFLFDLFLYSMYTVAVLAIYFIWDRVVNDRRIYFANFEHSIALIALVTLFIFGALPLAYIFSFLAKKPTSAFSSFCVLTILTGTATLTLVSLYELKYEHSASTTFKVAFTIFLWSARLIPSVSLLIGLQKLFALNTTRAICINISPEVLDLLCRYINSPLVDDELRVLRPERCCRQVCGNECYDQWPFFWSGWFGVNVELAMLVFDACLLWFILVLIESRSIRGRLVALICKFGTLFRLLLGCGTANGGGVRSLLSLNKANKYCWQVPQCAANGKFGLKRGSCDIANVDLAGGDNSKNKNKDLQVEQLKIDQILQTRTAHNYSMVVNDLTKVYRANKFKAVDRLSFVVDKREFFGLLGVNGAGKSSTFKMLTGELRPTAGNAWIGPHEICRDRKQFLKSIGYCPQQDALIDRLTGAETLTLFARLRGIPEHQIELAVEDTLDKLGLKRVGHVESNNYSGGNKRRLSVGMALIGAPEVIFLDEPTSGVDPRSRRRLWSTLIEFQQQTKSSIVMTSHSMNECECLCDRVAIMVGGQFKVLGSIQYLRTKLSQGFSLVLKMKPDQLSDASELLRSSETIRAYMESKFSSSQLQLRDLHQTIIQYHIQPNEQLTWSKMLVALEEAKRDLDLEDYQITSDASLESIFLSLAKQQQQAAAAVTSVQM